MKENIKTALFCITILMLFIGSLVYAADTTTRHEEQIWRAASDLGYRIGYQQAEWNIAPFVDHIYNYRGGDIYNISIYQTVELPRGYYYNKTYYPYNITFYKIDLDLTGFTWCDPSPYVNPNGTRYVTFRYCKEGPFPGPGHYKFDFLDVDFMEIIYWERVER